MDAGNFRNAGWLLVGLFLLVLPAAAQLQLAGAGPSSQNAPELTHELRSSAFSPAPEPPQELHSAQSSLPDAPSAAPALQQERLHASGQAVSPLIFDGTAINAGVAGLAPAPTPNFSAWQGVPVLQTKANGAFDNPSPGRQTRQYQPPLSDSFLGRASYAASRLLITRDSSGRRKLNASYLLRVLALSAAANASYRPNVAVAPTMYRPYRTPPVSTTFGNFGSNIGGDAGSNVFHELWPRIRQILGGHSLQVLEKVQERIR